MERRESRPDRVPKPSDFSEAGHSQTDLLRFELVAVLAGMWALLILLAWRPWGA